MAVNRSQRIYPLALKSAADYPLNAGIVAAYDWAGDPNNSYAGGDGAAHAGTWDLVKEEGAEFPVVTVAPGVLGRDISQGMRTDVRQAYLRQYADKLGIGSADGKGPFTIHNRYRTYSVYTGTTGTRTLATYVDSTGTKIRLVTSDHPDGYMYFGWELSLVFSSSKIVPSQGDRFSLASLRVPHNTIVDLHLVRNGADFYYYINSVLAGTVNIPDYLLDNAPWTGKVSGQHGFSGETPANAILIDMTLWNRALSASEVAAHQADVYAGYNNTGTSEPPPPTTTKPAAPTGVTATAGENSVTVNGTPGSDGGSPITSFAARIYRASDNVIVANVSSATLPITATGVAAVPVYARLTATNEVGESDPSAPSINVTPTSPAATGTPVRFDFPASYAIYAAEEDLGIDSVAITPTQATVEGGATYQFNAQANGTAANKDLDWTAPLGGTVNSFGTFTAPASTDTEQQFTVRATSALDPTKWAEATITVPAVEVAKVTSVSISPLAVVLEGGAQQQFDAFVDGPDDPDQAVTYTATAGAIDALGLFTAPPGAVFPQTVKVRATSDLDPTKWAEATVAISALAVIPEDSTRTVSFVLGEIRGPAANLTDVMVSLHAATGPHATGAALYQSASASTDESGVLSFSMQTTAIAAGDPALLSVLTPDGRHYLGLVTVL